VSSFGPLFTANVNATRHRSTHRESHPSRHFFFLVE
jgi:hypothetical protein